MSLDPKMAAIAQAYELMQALRFTTDLPEDVRHELTYCLRHFPEVHLYIPENWSKEGEGSI